MGVLLLLSMGLATGCGSFYRTLAQQSHAAGNAIKSAPLFKIRPLSWEGVPRPEDYDTDESWREETRNLAPAFAAEVNRIARQEGLAGRVSMAGPNEKVQEGVLVDARVVDLRRTWNPITSGFDFITVELKFHDVTSGAMLYQGKLEVSSKRYPPVGWRGATLAGRLTFAGWNLMRPLFSIIKTGRVDPEEG